MTNIFYSNKDVTYPVSDGATPSGSLPRKFGDRGLETDKPVLGFSSNNLDSSTQTADSANKPTLGMYPLNLTVLVPSPPDLVTTMIEPLPSPTPVRQVMK